LGDSLELALNTNKNSDDSDSDGFKDADEIYNGFDPTRGDGGQVVDSGFAQKQSGYFFIAVENRGELWFVSDKDYKRYLLSSETDLLNIIRKAGVGILKNNFDKLIKSN
jgi:hypothetical protein